MRKVAWFTAFAFALNCSGFAASASTSIPSLRHDRILGSLASTAVMRERVQAHEARLARAGALIGLTPDEFAAWRSQILTSPSLSYVELPHHLNAMTGFSVRRGVYVIRDVDIPTSYGWEIDLDEPAAHRALALYLPSDCGNLSLLKKPARVLALATERPPLPPPFHTARPTPPPVVAAIQTTPAPVLTPAPVVLVHHHPSILPYVGIAALGGVIYLLQNHCTCPSPPPGYYYISGDCRKIPR
jgi:hypothetical protein